MLGATMEVQPDFVFLLFFFCILEKKVINFYRGCWKKCSIEGDISGY